MEPTNGGEVVDKKFEKKDSSKKLEKKGDKKERNGEQPIR